MKRQLNTRLLLALILPAILVAIGGFVLQRSRIPQLADRERERAKSAKSEDKLDEAAVHLQRYLAYKPDDYEALGEYGLLLDSMAEESQQARSQALPVLSKALQKEPDDIDIRKALVNLCVQAGLRTDQSSQDKATEWFIRALSYLDNMPEGALTEPAEQAWAELQRGRSLAGQSKFDEAESAYDRAITAAPNQIDAYKELASLYQDRLNQPDKAKTIYDRMVAANPDNADAYIARGDHRRPTDPTAAASDFARALELAPDNPEALEGAAVAESAERRPNVERIRALLNHAIEVDPQRARTYRLLALFEKNLNKTEAAEQLLQTAYKKTVAIDVAWDLINLWIDTGNLQKAEKLKGDLDTRGDLPQPLTQYLAARIQNARGQWEAAGSALEKIILLLDSRDRPEWWIFAAQAHHDLGAYYERKKRQETIAKTDEIQLNRLTAQALASHTRAAELDPIPLEYQIARARLAGNVEAFPQTTLDAQILRISLMMDAILRRPAAQRDWTPVETAIDQIEQSKAKQDVELVPILRAELDLERGQIADARRRIEAARDTDPDRLPLWLMLSRIAERDGRIGEAGEILAEAERRIGDSPELFAARVRFWSGRETELARRALAREAARIANFPGDKQEELTLLLARGLERVRDDKASLALWKDLSQRLPTNLGVSLGLFDVAFRAGDNATMAKCVERLKEAEGAEKGTLWKYAEAGRLVASARPTRDAPNTPPENQSENLEAARKLLTEVEAGRPNWSRVPLLQAVMAEIKNDRAAAIDAYSLAVDRGERQISVVSRLVELLYDAKLYDKADEAIRKLELQTPEIDERLKRIQVDSLLGLGQRQRALNIATSAVPADSQDYRDFIWLGQVYAATRQLDDAEKALRHAVELAPNAPEPRIVLLQFLFRANTPPAALEAEIDRAAQAMLADQAALFLARAYEIIGRADRADALFQKALAAKPGDLPTIRASVDYYLSRDQFSAAEPLLRTTIDKPDSTATDRAWARRTLALALSRPANDARFNEAIVLIDANIQADPASLDDKRVKAYILSARPERRDEAITAFDQIGDDLRPDDRLLLARLNEAQGHWKPIALDQLKKLVADQPEQPQYLVALVRSLLRHKELDDAEKYINSLNGMEPGSLRTLALHGELLKAQNRPVDKVVNQLRDLAKALPQPDRAAALIEQLGEIQTAENLYRELAQRADQPTAAAQLAQFLGRQGRPKEGIEVCEAARAATPTLAVAAALGILSSSSLSDDDARRVERWIDEALLTAQPAMRTELECQRGILLALEGRRDESIALHRRLLEAEPTNAQVLNNLAWILALTGGDPNEALALIDKAIRINLGGPAPALLDTRSVVRLAGKEPRRAIEDASIAIGSNPDEPIYYFHLARAQHAADDSIAATESLNKAIERGLTSSIVDPLERSAYAELVAELRPE